MRENIPLLSTVKFRHDSLILRSEFENAAIKSILQHILPRWIQMQGDNNRWELLADLSSINGNLAQYM